MSPAIYRRSACLALGESAFFSLLPFAPTHLARDRQNGLCRQAARTASRNLPTSILRRWLSTDSDWAEESTCDEAAPVSLAPRCTSTMLDETCWVPRAACWTLREISCVATPCSSTAAAMVDDISDSLSMVPLI